MSDRDPSELPLRDIHLPDAVSWWPPAPGWWVIAAVLAAAAAALGIASWRRRTARRRAARRRIRELETEYLSDGDVSRLLQGLSALMRRAALSTDDRTEVAAITGNDWLRYLDRGLDDRPFTTGRGRVLAIGPYARAAGPGDREAARALIDLCRRRLETMPL